MKKLAEIQQDGGRMITYSCDAARLGDLTKQVHKLLWEITDGPHEGIVVLQTLLDIYKETLDIRAVTKAPEAQA